MREHGLGKKISEVARMPPAFQKLEIENYRGLRHLTIDGLGRVNLITGRNTSGKSSVLEAIRLLASNGQMSMLHQIMLEREILTHEVAGDASSMGTDGGINALSQLFHGYPSISHNIPPLRIVASRSYRVYDLEIHIVVVTEETTEDGGHRLRKVGCSELPGDSIEQDLDLALLIRSANIERILPIDSFRRVRSRFTPLREIKSTMTIRCRHLGPHGGQRTDILSPLWDEIALTERESDVVAALRIIEPRIQAVSMVGSNERNRMAIVRAEGFAHTMPLRTFGDGLNRLFGLALSLVSSAGGLLLIDEFENGMHFSVLHDVWRTIFFLARKLDVQVIATSHSWDVIEAFQRAAAEDPDDGVLIRLTRRNEDVVPTVFTEDELAIVTRDRIEVR